MKVSEFFSGPEKWTKKAYARDKKGSSVCSNDPGAVCWCLAGAVLKCYGGDEGTRGRISEADRVIQLINEEVSFRGAPSLAAWNDTDARTFEEVKALAVQLGI